MAEVLDVSSIHNLEDLAKRLRLDDITPIITVNHMALFRAIQTDLNRAVMVLASPSQAALKSFLSGKFTDKSQEHLPRILEVADLPSWSAAVFDHDASGVPFTELADADWLNESLNLYASLQNLQQQFCAVNITPDDVRFNKASEKWTLQLTALLRAQDGCCKSVSAADHAGKMLLLAKRRRALRRCSMLAAALAILLISLHWGLSDSGPTSLPPSPGETTHPASPHYTNCKDLLCAKRITGLFRDQQFAQLESIAQKLRSEKTKIRSGEWGLALFYQFLARGDREHTLLNQHEVLSSYDLWIKQFPESTTALIAKSEVLTAYGLAEWSNLATSGDFSTRRKRALKHYSDALGLIEVAKEKDNSDPHLYALWIQLLMLQSRAAQVAVAPALLANIYSTARKLEPTYHHLYYNLAWHYLNCWNGAPGDLEKFAMQAHKDTQDISGFNIYAMIAMHLLRGSNIKRFAHFNLDWSILRPQIVDLIAKHPRSQENLIYFLWFACRWQDRELAREIINKLDHLSKKWPQLSMPLWLGEQNYLAWRKWAVTDGPPPKN